MTLAWNRFFRNYPTGMLLCLGTLTVFVAQEPILSPLAEPVVDRLHRLGQVELNFALASLQPWEAFHDLNVLYG